MKPGNKIILITFFLIFSNILNSEERIASTPLINMEQIKPSFEDLDNKEENFFSTKDLKEKKIKKKLK